jgi:hypothetical protein
VIFVGRVWRIYKLAVSGKIIGEFGDLGRLHGWFDWVHCPDGKTLHQAAKQSDRFDEVVPQ